MARVQQWFGSLGPVKTMKGWIVKVCAKDVTEKAKICTMDVAGKIAGTYMLSSIGYFSVATFAGKRLPKTPTCKIAHHILMTSGILSISGSVIFTVATLCVVERLRRIYQ